MSELLTHALKYLSKNISVIPVGQNKIPLVKWIEFQNRFATEAEVKEWWTKWPESNIGIITGKISNIIVVDVEKGGDISKFPSTAIVRTGGDGWHLYYQYADIENKVRVFPLTDIRGNGGYVVAPPSLHSSGKKYEVIERRNLSPFPIHLFGGKNLRPKKDWEEIIKGVNEGSRNANAAKIAGKLLKAFAPSEWEGVVWLMLVRWNSGNEPPLSEYELKNIYRSIAKRELAQRRGSDNVDEIQDEIVLNFTDVVKLGMEELDNTNPESVVSFGYDWLDDKLTGIFPGDMIVLGGETGTGKTTFGTKILIKASQKHKCHIFALEDRLQNYGIKAVYYELGRIRHNGGLTNYPWNDFRKNCIKDSMYSEFRQEAEKNLVNSNLTFSGCEEMIDIDKLEKLIEKKVLEGVNLFLIDHLHFFDLLKGKNNKSDYVEHLMIRLALLRKRTGARIILIVHYKKLDGAKPRLDSFKDSVSIPQNADYTINLWRDRSEGADRYKTLVIIPKSRNPNGETTIEVEFDPVISDYKFNNEKFGTGEPATKEINVETLNF
ncbi:MAG: bifunctional DNA primase/polymerase [Elusimicrobia bacterium]|nr:bifunctional DNA primase/polymerase [Elusimicrobiota bacterium]